MTQQPSRHVRPSQTSTFDAVLLWIVFVTVAIGTVGSLIAVAVR